MTAKNKTDYIEAWTEYIRELYPLALNPDKVLSKEIQIIIDDLLYDKLPRVARAKYPE